MNAISRSCLAVAAGVVVSFGGGLLRAETTAGTGPSLPLPTLEAPDLAKGPNAAAHMLFQKTILHVNVANVDVRFGKTTQAQLAQIIHGQAFSTGLETQLAPIVIGADRAVVQMQFLRDIPLNRWIGVVRDNLEQARSAGLISREIEQLVGGRLPQLFSALDKRGYEKGDRIVYSVTPEGLRTAVFSAGGQVLVDIQDRDPRVRKVVLASYFAPKSDFREPLLKSLVEASH
jgi:hypothetical protein